MSFFKPFNNLPHYNFLRSFRTKRRLGLIIILVGFLAAALISYTRHQPLAQSPTSANLVNLIHGQDWSHMAGVSQNNSGVHISGMGRAIVNQDDSGGQPNPPVNVRGPHLSLKGGFKVTFTMDNLPKNGSASLYLYGAVPVIYDEWRYQTPQLQIGVTPQSVTLKIWDGSVDTPVDQRSWSIDYASTISAVLVSANHLLYVFVSGHEIGRIADHSIFSQGNIWFGLDAPVGISTWVLSNLQAQAFGKGKLKIIPAPNLKISSAPAATLRNLASSHQHHLTIGAAVANYALFSDVDYRKLVATQFNMLTPENELKAQFVHPQPSIYSFIEADSLVDFALANHMAVHGHSLVFSEANPRWMQTAPINERQAIMMDHIKTVVSHFGNKIPEWDVVDEPLNDNDSNHGNSNDLRRNIWSAAMGESYIDIAFKTARAANPSAKLYINEYGLEADGSRWDKFLALIKRLQDRGVPIDGVGFQAHVHERGDEIDRLVLEQHMKQLAGMGLASRVSEIDVYGDNPNHQVEQYASTLQSCLNVPSCTSFTMWGITDRYGSTTILHTYPLQYGNDLIWDSSLKPKTAYYKLRNVLAAN